MTSTPFSVTHKVCSNCADISPSWVTAVHLSERIFKSGLPKILMEFFVVIVLTPIKFKIFEPNFNLGLSFWFNSLKFLKYEIPFALAATRKITRNSSIAPLFNFTGHLIALSELGLLTLMSAIFSPL